LSEPIQPRAQASGGWRRGAWPSRVHAGGALPFAWTPPLSTAVRNIFKHPWPHVTCTGTSLWLVIPARAGMTSRIGGRHQK
jgi:hypothetical protein